MALSIPQIPSKLDLRSKPPQDPKDTPAFIKDLVEALQKQMFLISTVVQGLEGADVLANRPPAARPGRTFYATDNGHFYVDDGTNWNQLI